MSLLFIELSKTVKLTLSIAIPVVLLLAGIILIFILRKASQNKKMHHELEEFFQAYVAKKPEERSFERAQAPEYDYVLTTERAKIYIMVVANAAYWEIKINSPTKWQYRRNTSDEAVRFVSRVDRLMRFDPPVEPTKNSKRVYIIYPSIKSLLRQINECEMEFVRPTTDINGTTVLTFDYMNEHKDSIEF